MYALIITMAETTCANSSSRSQYVSSYMRYIGVLSVILLILFPVITSALSTEPCYFSQTICIDGTCGSSKTLCGSVSAMLVETLDTCTIEQTVCSDGVCGRSKAMCGQVGVIHVSELR